MIETFLYLSLKMVFFSFSFSRGDLILKSIDHIQITRFFEKFSWIIDILILIWKCLLASKMFITLKYAVKFCA